MGERGGNADFPKISLAGKTGTERQKEYAESLLDAARGTAIRNGIAGEHDTDKPGIKRYILQEDADSYVGAYRLLKNGVDMQKTYGGVIDFVKSQDILRIAHNIRNGAKASGKSVKEFVDDVFESN